MGLTSQRCESNLFKNEILLYCMKTRLKVLSWLFAVIYMVVLLHNFVAVFVPAFVSAGRDGFRTGVEAGKESKNSDNEKNERYHSLDFIRRIYVELNPVDGQETYPDKILNQKTGKEELAENRSMYIKLADVSQLPAFLIIGNTFILCISLVALFIFIYIPILSFKIVKSISRDDIFDYKNIRRIRRIGYSMLGIFLFALVYAFITKATADYLLSLQNYKIVFSLDGESTSFLIFGIVVLIFAEVLKISTQIKEEQDFTI